MQKFSFLKNLAVDPKYVLVCWCGYICRPKFMLGFDFANVKSLFLPFHIIIIMICGGGGADLGTEFYQHSLH